MVVTIAMCFVDSSNIILNLQNKCYGDRQVKSLLENPNVSAGNEGLKQQSFYTDTCVCDVTPHTVPPRTWT